MLEEVHDGKKNTEKAGHEVPEPAKENRQEQGIGEAGEEEVRDRCPQKKDGRLSTQAVAQASILCILPDGPVVHHGTPQFLAYHPGYVSHNIFEICFQVPNVQKHVLYAALGPKD